MGNPKKKFLVGIDVGGTKILAGLVDKKFRLLATHKSRVEANKGAKNFFGELEETVRKLLAGAGLSLKHVQAIGVGCPGMILLPAGIVTLSPNLSFLKNCPLKSKLRKIFKVPIALENDANAGLYGEYYFGAAKGHRNAAGIFLGTGVGGAFILDGKIYRGDTGAAGEIGHTFLSIPDFTGRRESTVEGELGRLRIASDAGLLVMRQKAPYLFKAAGYDIKKIKSNTLAKCVKAGDEAVRLLLTEKARILGIAMANVVNLLNPSLIVLGGGLVEAVGYLILPVSRKVMQEYALRPLAKEVKVVSAKLKDDAIIMGAVKLASEEKERL